MGDENPNQDPTRIVSRRLALEEASQCKICLDASDIRIVNGEQHV